MTKIRLLLSLTLLLGTLTALAQPALILEREGSIKRKKIFVGDVMRFKQFNNDSIYDDQISGLCDTAVIFGNRIVPIRTIQKVYIGRERFLPTLLKGVGIAGGLLFFGIDSFNRLTNRDSPLISKAAMIVLGSGLGMAGVMTLTEIHWFHVGGKKRIRYLDMTIG